VVIVTLRLPDLDGKVISGPLLSVYLMEFLEKKPGFLPEVVLLVIAQKPGFFCIRVADLLL
jgi:hypothetical protein